MIDENNLEGFTKIEELYFRVSNEKKIEDKIKFYEVALESNEYELNEEIEILQSILQLYIENKEYSLQVNTLERLIEKEPLKENDYLNQIVKIYKSSDIKDYIVAIDYQLKILKTSKKTTDYFEIIELYSLLNDTENKKKYQKKLIEIYYELIEEKKDNQTIVNSYKIKLIELFIDLKDYIEVPSLYKSLIQNDKANSVKYSEELAKFYKEKRERYPNAIKQYQELISINVKKEIEYLENIAILYEKIPNFGEMINIYNELILKNESNEERYLNQIVSIYTEKIKEYPKALDTYNILESKFDKNTYQEKMAEFHLKYTKDYYKAIELYKNVGEHYSNKIRCEEIIANIYEEYLKEYDKAINQYEELINSSSVNKEIYQKSIIRLYANDKEDLKSTIEKIIEFFGEIPKDQEIQSILEKAQIKQEAKEIETKERIGENFEKTEKEFFQTSLIYLFIVINIVFLLIILNKDIFYKSKQETHVQEESIKVKNETNK